MKVLRLSDEDYGALLIALERAASNARAIEWEVGDCRDYSEEEQEANRLYNLIKPMEYPVEPHTLIDEKIAAMVEAMNLLRIAGVNVTMTNTKSFSGESADLTAHHEQPNYFAAAKMFGED